MWWIGMALCLVGVGRLLYGIADSRDADADEMRNHFVLGTIVLAMGTTLLGLFAAAGAPDWVGHLPVLSMLMAALMVARMGDGGTAREEIVHRQALTARERKPRMAKMRRRRTPIPDEGPDERRISA